MGAQRITRCCSAVALILASTIAVVAQSSRPAGDRAPFALFPIETSWTIVLDRQLIVPPAYDAERAYFATDEGRVTAYELAHGTAVWSGPAHPRHELAAGDGLLFIVEPDLLTARRALDGGVAWQVPFTGTLMSPPVWSSGHLAVATNDGAIVLMRSSDGQVLWRRDFPSLTHSRLAFALGRVYVPTSDGRLVSLRTDTGHTVWERRLGGTATDILALDARVYVGSTDNFFYCLNTRDGRVEWRWRTGADVVGVPAIDERSIYFVSLDNVLRALSRTTGVQRWFRPLSVRPTAGPILAGTTLVVPAIAPTLPAYGAKDGAPSGELAAGNGDTAALVHLVSNETTELPGVVLVTRGAASVTATRVTHQR